MMTCGLRVSLVHRLDSQAVADLQGGLIFHMFWKHFLCCSLVNALSSTLTCHSMVDLPTGLTYRQAAVPDKQIRVTIFSRVLRYALVLDTELMQCDRFCLLIRKFTMPRSRPGEHCTELPFSRYTSAVCAL